MTVANNSTDPFNDDDYTVEYQLLDDWADGQLCTGLFDGETPEFDSITIGRYSTDELPLDEIK